MGTLSVVVPAWNEEAVIEQSIERLRNVLDGLELDGWEIVFAVDPSTDRTEELILRARARDERIRMLRFSRRFGQAAATLAGMQAASGDAVVIIDADLQDPPETIADLVAEWRKGYDVVYARRRSRAGEPKTKLFAARMAYRVINRLADVDIPIDVGDFRLMSRRVVERVVTLEEAHGFIKGLVALVGFSQTEVLYDRDPRAAGETKYGRWMGSIVIGLNGVVGFSTRPLQWISLTGVFLSVGALIFTLVYVVLQLSGVQEFPVGNPTIAVLVSFFSGIQLLSLGIMGEYVGRIYDEVKHRPKFIVQDSHGVPDIGDGRPQGAVVESAHGLPEPVVVADRARG